VDFEQIQYEVSDRIARITLDRPEKLNAFSRVMLSEVEQAFEAVRSDVRVRVVILRGAGRSFSSGHDLTEVYEGEPDYALTTPIALERRRGYADLARLRSMLWNLPQPIIAQVHGHCFNLAVEIAMHCDLVYAAEDAEFVVRPLGGAGRYYHLWPWLVGFRQAKEMLLTADPVSGARAAATGMINEAVPLGDLEQHVEEAARRIARRSVDLLAIEKRCLNKCVEYMGMLEGLEYSMELHAMSHFTAEAEAVTDALSEDGWRAAVAVRDAKFQ
jgi:enoyl-CoA hydratase